MKKDDKGIKFVADNGLNSMAYEEKYLSDKIKDIGLSYKVQKIADIGIAYIVWTKELEIEMEKWNERLFLNKFYWIYNKKSI